MNVTTRVRNVALWSVEERSEDTIVDRTKNVDQNDGESDEDVVEVHDGRREEDAEVERRRKSRFICPQNTGGNSRRHSENL